MANSVLEKALQNQEVSTTLRDRLVKRVFDWLKQRGYSRDASGQFHSSATNSSIDVVRIKRQYMLDHSAYRDPKAGITETALKDVFDEAIELLADGVIEALGLDHRAVADRANRADRAVHR